MSKTQTFGGCADERECVERAGRETLPEEAIVLSDLGRNTSLKQTIIWFFFEV